MLIAVLTCGKHVGNSTAQTCPREGPESEEGAARLNLTHIGEPTVTTDLYMPTHVHATPLHATAPTPAEQHRQHTEMRELWHTAFVVVCV